MPKFFSFWLFKYSVVIHVSNRLTLTTRFFRLFFLILDLYVLYPTILSVSLSSSLTLSFPFFKNRAVNQLVCYLQRGIRWVGLARLTSDGAGGGPLADFVEGLGPGQLVGRQVLAAPALGDVQLALCDRKGRLEVEVIRARGLQARAGSKLLPGNYFPF